MKRNLVERIKQFQLHLLELGVARGVLGQAAPRMLASPSPDASESSVVNAFQITIAEEEIVSVSRDLFASGHYSLAVQEAFKAVEKFIQTRVNIDSIAGAQLMDQVFTPVKPKLFWTTRHTISEQDEQKGYHRLYSGALLGIRNPVAHEFNWVDDPHVALELIVFAQHLIRKARTAKCDGTL